MMRNHLFTSAQVFATLLFAVILLTVNERVVGQEAKQEWGNLSATFLYDGEPPPPKPIKVDKDQESLREPIYDRSLVVDRETKGIQYVCVWLLSARDAKPAIHPDYDAQAKKPVVIKIDNMEFQPYITGMRLGQALRIEGGKHDPGHNPSITPGHTPPAEFSQLLPANNKFDFNIIKPTNMPIAIACSVHPWAEARLIVQDHPYMAVSDANGKLQIKNLPVGKHKFFVWHDRAGLVREAQIGDNLQNFKGRLEVQIKPGENELGKVLISAKQFEAKK